MSGGAFNYLCRKYDAADMLNGGMSDLADMAEALEARGDCPEAARETRELLADLRGAASRAETAISRLQALWKAVEWHRSCDWNEEEVTKAIAAYRKQTPVQTAQVPTFEALEARIQALEARLAQGVVITDQEMHTVLVGMANERS